MKTSPLCSRDNGREIFFTANVDGRKHRLTAPRELLDDLCGSTASEKQRKSWVTENKDACLGLLAQTPITKPFDRILVEEIS